MRWSDKMTFGVMGVAALFFFINKFIMGLICGIFIVVKTAAIAKRALGGNG